MPGAADARTLYKALGLDPTKTRPSNEALLRRALKGEALYRDQHARGRPEPVLAALPAPFRALRPRPGGAAGRRCAAARRARATKGSARGRCTWKAGPCWWTPRGPFGNPTSDSARTMITLETRRALVVVYAPGGYASARLREVADGTAAALTRFCGGSVAERRLVPASTTTPLVPASSTRRGAHPRRPLPRPARGGAPRRRAAPHHRGRGHRQDHRPHAAHRPPHLEQARAARGDPGPHLHREGGRSRWRSAWTSSSPTATRRRSIGTFHAFGDRVLREAALEGGLNPEFRVLTRPEQIIFLRERLWSLPLRRFRPLGDPTRHLAALLGLVSRAKDEDVSPEEYRAWAAARAATAADDVARDEAERHLELAAFYAAVPGPARRGGRSSTSATRSTARSACCATRPGAARAPARALPLHPGGRVPGHEPRPARDGAAPRRRGLAQHHGGGRRRPGHLPLARGGRRQPAGLPRALSRARARSCSPRTTARPRRSSTRPPASSPTTTPTGWR